MVGFNGYKGIKTSGSTITGQPEPFIPTPCQVRDLHNHRRGNGIPEGSVGLVVSSAADIAANDNKVGGIEFGYFCIIHVPPVPVIRRLVVFPPVIDVVALGS